MCVEIENNKKGQFLMKNRYVQKCMVGKNVSGQEVHRKVILPALAFNTTKTWLTYKKYGKHGNRAKLKILKIDWPKSVIQLYHSIRHKKWLIHWHFQINRRVSEIIFTCSYDRNRTIYQGTRERSVLSEHFFNVLTEHVLFRSCRTFFSKL